MIVHNWKSLGDCDIGANVVINDGVIIGKQFRPLQNQPPYITKNKTIIESGVYLGYYAIVGAGSKVGRNSIIDDFSLIESNVKLGETNLVIYKAQICNDAIIGTNCVIAGFVAERVQIGNNSRIMGKIVHSHHDPHLPWDAPEAEEGSAFIDKNVFVGFDALVVGGIRINEGSYICAGAIVTRDVPSRHIVHGINKLTPFAAWKGKLANSDFFHQT